MTIETRLHPGNRCVFLRADGGDGAVQLLAFVAAKERTLEVWQTPDERKVPPRRTGTFREWLEPLRIARLLASGDAGAHLDEALAAGAVVEGVDDEWELVLQHAWAHGLASRDPRLHALLSVEPDLLDACLERHGANPGLAAYGAIAKAVMEGNGAWLEEWREAIEAFVRGRAALYDRVKGAGETFWPTEGEIRALAEACLLKLGRLPREDEDESQWDGSDLSIAGLTPARREKLGLDVTSRIGRYWVRVRYLSAVEAFGWDFNQGAGWYLHVTNPHPDWRFNDPVGPYLDPEHAIADSRCLAEQE
jgi:hypothetical protein